jgi:predicted nucleic-acid-binding protein
VTGLDTTILIRFFVKDDPEQTRLALNLIYSLSPEEPGWVGLAVILELVWVMNRTYRVDRVQVIRVLDTLLSSQDIVVEQSNVVRHALQLHRSVKAGFPDCLIAASARAAGCARTVTFDRVPARDAGMQLIS